MRPFSTFAALDRHPELDVRPDPISGRALARRFDTGPSLSRLLRSMGPFIPATDAFRFENDFAISIEQAVDFADMLTDELVQEIVEQAVFPYTAQLRGIDLNPLPFLETRLPDVVVDFVLGRLQRELAARLIDLAASPIGSDFGRCGGMAFAGYDCYLAGVPIDPTVTSPPAEGVLGDYIYDRLLDSLRLNIGTFTRWVVDLHLRGFLNEVAEQALAGAVGTVVFGPIGAAISAFLAATTDLFDFPSGKKVLLDRTEREWTRLKEILDEQVAWPVGLVYGDKPSLWDQHQVLAIGYSDDGAGRGTLEIWDNEDGNVRSELRIDLRGGELVTSGRRSNVKGFFHEQYRSERPPAGIS
jgi:hypothetical protein